jgi:hypothetical protein
MQSGTMVFTQMSRVIFGQPAAATIVAVAERLGAKRVFLLWRVAKVAFQRVRKGFGRAR